MPTENPNSPDLPEPEDGVMLPPDGDESAKGWYDSSFDLKRGLWVIETDLDPAITHGVVIRKRTRHGAE